VERTPPALPAADACERMFRHPDDTGYVPPIFDRVDIRAPARMSGWQHGEPLGRGEMAGWMRLDGEAQVDTLGLLVLADALPPAVFNAGDPVGWVPTIELTVQVRAAPAAGWLSSRFTTERITRGFLEEDGEVFDADGRLVVLSRQLALTARGRST
jgi:acyl-CoA thioesterase